MLVHACCCSARAGAGAAERLGPSAEPGKGQEAAAASQTGLGVAGMLRRIGETSVVPHHRSFHGAFATHWVMPWSCGHMAQQSMAC